MSPEPMIVVERLVKDFGDVRAVDDVTLEIPAGEFFSMLGPSGCGKTTTLRVIAGFEEPDSGRVLLDGEDVTWVSPKKRNVNMVFQDYALFPHMTVARERRLRAQAQARRPRRDQLAGRRDAADRAAGGLRGPPPRGALGRPAPARRARAGARQPARRAAPRRAARGARPEAAPRDAARAQAHPAEHRDDLRLRHPRPGGGADDVGPDRGHGRRRRPAGRRARRRSTSGRRPRSSPTSSAPRTTSRSRNLQRADGLVGDGPR